MRNSKISIVKFLLIGIAMLMLSSSNILAQAVNITLPSVTRQSGSPDDTLHITTGDLTGKNVYSFQFTLSYTKNVVYITNALKSGLSTASGSLMNVNADTANGKITVAWAASSALSGSGTLVDIVVHYRNVGTTSLSVGSTFIYNSGTPAVTVTNGQVIIPSIAVGFGNMSAHVGDTVLIPITTTALQSTDNVYSFDFTATFNPTVLNMLDAQTTGTISASGLYSKNINNTAGTIKVAWAGGTKLVTSGGTLIYLKAVVLSAGTSTQTLTQFEYNTGTPTAGGLSGTLTASAIVKYSVSGVVSYENSANTPLKNVVVTLTPSSGSPMLDTTDATGAYMFTGLSAGTFTVAVAKTGGWGGVNASDALQAARYFQGLTTLDSLQILAGDVTNSGAVNNSDALDIVRRYVGLISSFAKPDWTFLPSSQSVTITNANVVVNVKALATGDVNESYVPSNTPKASAISVYTKAAMNVKPGATFELPISVAGDMQVGAVSLKLSYPASLVKFDGISVASGIIANEKDGVITLAWADLSGGNNPLALRNNSVLATVKFTANKNLADGSNLTFDLLPGSEFVDAKGAALNGSSLLVPEVNFTSPSTFAVKQNYPNPFNPSTTIDFSLPESGNVTLTIYNITGQEVAKLVNGVQNAGSHKVVWNASNLSSGIYFYRLNFDGSNKKYSDIKSMVLLK